MKKSLHNIKLFLLDMDGTIHLDNDLFDGVTEFLEYIKSIGISSTADDFLTSTDATILYLKKKAYNKIYALGTVSFKDQLKNPILYTVM